MTFSLPEIPDEQPEEIDYPSSDQGGGQESDQDSGSGKNPVDQASGLKDKYDNAQSLKDKLSGGAGKAGEAAGEATTGSGGVAGGAATSGIGGGTAATGAAGAGSTAGTVGATTATGAAGAAGTAGFSAGAGAASGFLSATPGVVLAAPVELASAATNKTGRKILLGGCIAIFGVLVMPAMAILVIFIFFLPIFGGGTGEAADLGGNSQNLTISKTASSTSIARGAAGARVTYTLTVTNRTTQEATNVSITDIFSSSPDSGFASQVTSTDYKSSQTIAALAPGQSAAIAYTVNIPHTDYDPGWILFNTATVTGGIAGTTEVSSAGATVVIGNPPTGPPAFSPLHNPFISGNVFGQKAQGSNGVYSHQGVDLGDSDRSMRSPFAQPAKVKFNNPEGDGVNDGFGNYIILESGEWQVLLAHLEYRSTLSVEQMVDASTVVGIMGNSGFVQSGPGGDGTHLHYEIRRNGELVNPVLFNALTPHP